MAWKNLSFNTKFWSYTMKNVFHSCFIGQYTLYTWHSAVLCYTYTYFCYESSKIVLLFMPYAECVMKLAVYHTDALPDFPDQLTIYYIDTCSPLLM